MKKYNVQICAQSSYLTDIFANSEEQAIDIAEVFMEAQAKNYNMSIVGEFNFKITDIFVSEV